MQVQVDLCIKAIGFIDSDEKIQRINDDWWIIDGQHIKADAVMAACVELRRSGRHVPRRLVEAYGSQEME